MSAADDVARMLTLVPWLLERQGAGIAEVAAAFAVGERTIRRDLAHLDFCGLPGLGGGDLFEVDIVGDRVVVRMADELRRPLRPTPREALRLVLTLDAVGAVLGPDLPALDSAVSKIRSALGIPEEVADVVEPDATATVAAARRAVRERRRVRLSYQGRGDATPQTREVDPWALQVRDGAWYLQGHDHAAGGLRTFRLDRTGVLTALDDPVTVAPPPELPPPRYQPGPDDPEVVLHLAPAATWIADAVELDDLTEDGGGVLVRFRTDAPAWVARLVLMAGGDAQVRAPASLRDEVRRLAAAARSPYARD